MQLSHDVAWGSCVWAVVAADGELRSLHGAFWRAGWLPCAALTGQRLLDALVLHPALVLMAVRSLCNELA